MSGRVDKRPQSAFSVLLPLVPQAQIFDSSLRLWCLQYVTFATFWNFRPLPFARKRSGPLRFASYCSCSFFELPLTRVHKRHLRQLLRLGPEIDSTSHSLPVHCSATARKRSSSRSERAKTSECPFTTSANPERVSSSGGGATGGRYGA